MSKKRCRSKSKSNGRVLWQGKSVFTDEDIVVIGTGFARPTANPKTGVMIQIWILAADKNPLEATKTGLDNAVCGECPLKPSITGICYVRTSDAPLMVWNCWKNGKGYPIATDKDMKWLKRKPVRLGAYGDPAALPYEVVKSWFGRNWTGYTHHWRKCDERFKSICMASCDDVGDIDLARSKGWIPFVTVDSYDTMPDNLLPCLATVGSELQCVECGLCRGTASKLSNRFKGIAIEIHGWRQNRFGLLGNLKHA